MAVTATVDKFGMTFADAYHKITRLTYESNDVKQYVYSDPTEEGLAIPPSEVFVKRNFCHYEVATYASTTTRQTHAEPIYRTHFNFEPSVEAEAADIIVQAYDHLKAQAGYEDAVDC